MTSNEKSLKHIFPQTAVISTLLFLSVSFFLSFSFSLCFSFFCPLPGYRSIFLLFISFFLFSFFFGGLFSLQALELLFSWMKPTYFRQSEDVLRFPITRNDLLIFKKEIVDYEYLLFFFVRNTRQLNSETTQDKTLVKFIELSMLFFSIFKQGDKG